MGQVQKEVAKPIDVAEWPTPIPTHAPATPTPFPKITLVPTATPATRPPATATPTPSTTTESTATGNTEALAAQVSALGGLSPVAVAVAITDNATIRQGPGASYAAVTTLERGKLAGVLGKNSGGDWLYVVDAGLSRGWLPIDALRVTGTLEGAPVLPPDPLAAIINQAIAAAASNSNAASSTGDASSRQTLAIADLKPVATARIARGKVDIRPGPGSEYAPIDTLTDDQEEISVLGLDPGRSWALVKPAFSETGWVSMDDLTVEGSLSNAPQVFTAWVDSNAIEVRRGPAIYHDMVGTLSINTLVQVLGLNEGRSWALVRPILGEGFGWTPLNFLTVGGRIADLPEAPELALPGQTASAAQAAAPAPVPARSIEQSQIVFQRSSGGDIMVLNPDGTDLRRITNGIDPVLSPDGQTIAFTRWQGDIGSLWVVDLDGTNERAILGEMRKAKGPDWSPDGSQIVLNYQHGGRLEEKEECYNLASGSPPRPPRNASRPVTRRSEGKFFICWTLPPDPHWGLRVVNVADGSFEDVDGGTYAFRPAWDPVQPWRIISDGGLGLLQVDLNRAAPYKITDNVNDGSPVFSPDGRYLAVTAGNQSGGPGYDIYRLNADGSGRVRLTQTPLWVPVQPDGQKPWNNVAPAWSPDGSQIAFLTDRTGRWEIWVMNADGSNQHPMFSDEINDRLQIEYDFVDERVLSWR